jgi:hypothetical protein
LDYTDEYGSGFKCWGYVQQFKLEPLRSRKDFNIQILCNRNTAYVECEREYWYQ